LALFIAKDCLKAALYTSYVNPYNSRVDIGGGFMRFSVRAMVLASLFAMLMVVSAYIRIPFPFVPMTLQTLFVFLSGMLLGPKLGSLSQVLYFFLGLLGLPVFAGGCGLQIFVSPTVGFILGFIVAAYVVGRISHDDTLPLFFRYGVAPFLGITLIYLLGSVGLYFNLNVVAGKSISWLKVLQIGVFPFITADILKGVGASMLSWKIVPILNRSGILQKSSTQIRHKRESRG
jgi:biotin transport system substrate-specific component